MSKTLVSIQLSGRLQGTIWYPPITCTKDFKVTFTPENKPFTTKWAGIRAALLSITNDGDFQDCQVAELFGKVTWVNGKEYITRYVNFTPGQAINDLIIPESEVIYPEYEEN